MVVLTFEFYRSYSGLGGSICGYYLKKCKKHFQDGDTYFDDGYAHIVAIAMSDDI